MQPKTTQSVLRSILLGTGIGIGLAVVFFAGFVVRGFVGLPSVNTASADSNESYELLDEVQSLLDQHYLRQQPDYTTREYSAVRGMLAALNDRFTFFIEPPVAASESDVLAGTYGGIGVQVTRSAAGEVELFPFADSPASRAGIQNGDILKVVNSTPLDPTLTQDAIDQLLRGEVKPDNGVQLDMLHAAGSTPYSVFVVFDVINVPSVVSRVLAEDPTLGYIQILRFTSRTPEELHDGANSLLKSNIRGVVLDLRGNTGGLLQESIEVADEFLDSGAIVYQDEPGGETAYSAHPGGSLVSLPLAVLVNGHTASGAEIVAGALRDDQRGILIGQRTFGKGTVQQIFQLSDHSSLHVTSAEWFTPSRSPLDNIGIEPDIPVEAAPDGRDVELVPAIEYLQNQLSESQSS